MGNIVSLVFRPIETILDVWQGSYQAKNRMLSGNFGPVLDEIFATDLEVVEGAIPSDLVGEFVRNGPNPKRIPRGGYHWFDGDGMLHGVRLTPDGKVNYVNRWTKTKRWLAEEAADRTLFIRIGEFNGKLGLVKALLWQLKTKLGIASDRTDAGTANTAAVYHDGKLMALVENDAPYVVQMIADGRLETLGRYTYGGKLKHPFTAHPKVDPDTGEMVFFGYRLDQRPFCEISTVSKDGELLRTVPLTLEKPVMMHDMAITKNYSIILDMPLEFCPENLAKGEFVFTFNKERPTRIGVLPRHATSEKEFLWTEFRSGYGFHTMNAWEEGDDEVIVILCRANNVRLGAAFNEETPMTEMKDGSDPHPHMFRINMKTGEHHEQQISDVCCEFPIVNPKHLGRRSQFGYAGSMGPPSPLMDGVVKFDLSGLVNNEPAKEIGKITYGQNKYAGECVFVAKSSEGDLAEDDGYLLTFVYDEKEDKSEFWVMDAKTMSPAPIARVTIPQRIPYGFHGIWVSEEDIRNQKPL